MWKNKPLFECIEGTLTILPRLGYDKNKRS